MSTFNILSDSSAKSTLPLLTITLNHRTDKTSKQKLPGAMILANKEKLSTSLNISVTAVRTCIENTAIAIPQRTVKRVGYAEEFGST